MSTVGKHSAIGLCIAALALLTMISTLVMSALSARSSPQPFFFAFEGLTLLAGGFGLAIGLGKFSVGRSLGLLCVAGAIGLAAVLGYQSAGKNIGGQSLMAYLLARAGVAAFFAFASAWFVLSRRPHESFSSLAKGALTGALFVAGSVIMWKFASAILGMHPMLAVAIFIIAGVFIMATLAASVHYTIRAFELGQVSAVDQRSTRTASSQTNAA